MKNKRQRFVSGGFTFIEVICTLIIIAILAVTVSAGRWTPAAVVSEAHILRAHLRYAQSLAMANNTADWSVLFAANSYTLRRDGQPAPIHLPDESSPTRVLAPGVTVVHGRGELTLNHWGAPTQTIAIVLSDGRSSEQVTMTGETGLVP